MSTLAKRYSSFLTSNYNYPLILRDLEIKFTSVYENIDYILDYDFHDVSKRFPKYIDTSKIITKLTSYDLLKIYNISSDNVKYLLEAIQKQHILSLKPILDSMPFRRKNYLQDFYLQCTYFASLENLYDYNYYFNLKNAHIGCNHYTQLFSPSFNVFLDEGSFIQIFSLQNLFIKTFEESCNSLNKLVLYFSKNDIINKNTVKNEFNDYITANLSDISKNICDLIFKTIYQYPEVSNNVIDLVAADISPEVEKIKDIFDEFSDIYISDPVFELCQLTNTALTNILAVEITKDLSNKQDYFDQSIVQTLIGIEEKIIKDYRDKVTSANIKEYLFLLFYYKFSPFKFLNNVPYIIKNFVENFLKTEIDYSLDINSYEYYLSQVSNSGNLSNIKTYLETYVNNTYLVTLNHSYTITKFIFNLYFIEKIDTFLNSKSFKDYVENILEKLFYSLRNHSHTKYDFNWYKNNEIVNVFFKSLFRHLLTTNILFHNNWDLFDHHVNLILSNSTGDSQYDVSFSFDETKLEISFNNIASYYRNLAIFHENHVTSTLTTELIYDYTSYFLINYSGGTPAGINYWYVEDDFVVS